eukprot:505888-Pleurochrysis_carterae.AAC.1
MHRSNTGLAGGGLGVLEVGGGEAHYLILNAFRKSVLRFRLQTCHAAAVIRSSLFMSSMYKRDAAILSAFGRSQDMAYEMCSKLAYELSRAEADSCRLHRWRGQLSMMYTACH